MPLPPKRRGPRSHRRQPLQIERVQRIPQARGHIADQKDVGAGGFQHVARRLALGYDADGGKAGGAGDDIGQGTLADAQHGARRPFLNQGPIAGELGWRRRLRELDGNDAHDVGWRRHRQHARRHSARSTHRISLERCT